MFIVRLIMCSSSCFNKLCFRQPQAERLNQQGKLLELVDQRLGSDYSQEQALRLLNIALLCTKTSPTQRPRMSSVVKMLCGQIPIEVVPDDDNLSEDLRFDIARSQCSMNDSKTDWSQMPSKCSMNDSKTDWSQMPSSNPSILLHTSKDSGYLPSSSSSSLKLWAHCQELLGSKAHGVGNFF